MPTSVGALGPRLPIGRLGHAVFLSDRRSGWLDSKRVPLSFLEGMGVIRRAAVAALTLMTVAGCGSTAGPSPSVVPSTPVTAAPVGSVNPAPAGTQPHASASPEATQQYATALAVAAKIIKDLQGNTLSKDYPFVTLSVLVKDHDAAASLLDSQASDTFNPSKAFKLCIAPLPADQTGANQDFVVALANCVVVLTKAIAAEDANPNDPALATFTTAFVGWLTGKGGHEWYSTPDGQADLLQNLQAWSTQLQQ
jgi:hypothetical protein